MTHPIHMCTYVWLVIIKAGYHVYKDRQYIERYSYITAISEEHPRKEIGCVNVFRTAKRNGMYVLSDDECEVVIQTNETRSGKSAR